MKISHVPFYLEIQFFKGYKDLIKIFPAVFEKIAIFCFETHLKAPDSQATDVGLVNF
jgi:hypothetical protein